MELDEGVVVLLCNEEKILERFSLFFEKPELGRLIICLLLKIECNYIIHYIHNMCPQEVTLGHDTRCHHMT